jgi:hypothetical protein
MKKISSPLTTLYKKILPAIMLGFLVVLAVASFSSEASLKQRWILLAIPLLMAVFLIALGRKMLWDLVDEVFDCGDALLIKNGDQHQRIPLSGIMNVSATLLINPPRVTLRLVHPSQFGNEISFMPIRKATLNPFARSPIVDDLIVRVDRARTQR